MACLQSKAVALQGLVDSFAWYISGGTPESDQQKSREKHLKQSASYTNHTSNQIRICSFVASGFLEGPSLSTAGWVGRSKVDFCWQLVRLLRLEIKHNNDQNNLGHLYI